MKKLLTLCVILLITILNVTADTVTVKINYKRKTQPGPIGGAIGRIPMNLPIDVTFDDMVGSLMFTAPETQTGCIYIYDLDGTQEAYSPTLNASFTLTQTGDIHIISLQGDTWIGEAKIMY